MRRSTGLTLIAFALVVGSGIVGAQGTSSPVASSTASPSHPRGLGAGISTLSAAEEARLAERISDADALTFDGRMVDAARTLREVIREQRRGGAYPAATLRRLANVEFALDRPLAAAAVLEELAAEAVRVADPDTELHALVDASVLYIQFGRTERKNALAGRIRILLASPGVSEEARRAVPMDAR